MYQIKVCSLQYERNQPWLQDTVNYIVCVIVFDMNSLQHLSFTSLFDCNVFSVTYECLVQSTHFIIIWRHHLLRFWLNHVPLISQHSRILGTTCNRNHTQQQQQQQQNLTCPLRRQQPSISKQNKNRNFEIPNNRIRLQIREG